MSIELRYQAFPPSAWKLARETPDLIDSLRWVDEFPEILRELASDAPASHDLVEVDAIQVPFGRFEVFASLQEVVEATEIGLELLRQPYIIGIYWESLHFLHSAALARSVSPEREAHQEIVDRLFKGSDTTRLAGRAAWLLSEIDVAAAYRYLEGSPLARVDLAELSRHSRHGKGALSGDDLGEMRELHAHQVQYFSDVAELGWCVFVSCST